MTQRSPPFWSNLPLAIGAMTMIAGSVLLLANVAFGLLKPGRRIDIVSQLYGVVDPHEVPFSLRAVADGRFQAAFAKKIGTLVPLFSPAVRLRNQIEFSLFGASATPDVTVGKKQELLETRYVQEYCSRDLAAFRKIAPRWASQIREIQNDVERRGQTFVFVLTPSKVAQYPQYIPSDAPCPSSEKDRTGVVPAALDALRAAGVHTIDTTGTLWAARRDYPFELFPRGGTHWNDVGGVLGAQAVEAGIESLRGDGLFNPLSFTWRITPHPVGVDIDLVKLMNLIWPPDHFEVPTIAITQAPRALDCHPISVAIVGGSFMFNVGAALSQLPCGARVVEYQYWTWYRVTWPGGVINKDQGFAPAARDADLGAANVIIYEENESLLANAKLDVLLLRWLKEHAART